MPLTLSGTNGVSGVDGSASTPANRGSDTNTGIVYGTDTVQIATGGTTAVTVDSSQNVGIGTTSSSAKLHVFGNSSSAIAIFDKNGANQGYYQLKNSTQSYSTYIDINNNGTNWLALYDTTNSSLIDVYVPGASSYRSFYTVGAERARIDSSGNLLVGRTSQLNIGRLEVYNPVNGQGIVCQVSNNTYSNFQGFNAAGSATFGVTGAGALTKASGTFKIDHPLPALTDTHHLVHSFIEGPQADLIYRGVVQLVDGKATVNIDEASDMTDGTFVLLCREVQCFTSNETNWDAVRGKVTGNILTIESQNSASTASVSWLVIGERQDKHIMETDWTDANGKVIVEPLKSIVGEAK